MKAGSTKKPEGKTGKKKLPKNIRIYLDADEAILVVKALNRLRPSLYQIDWEIISEVESRLATRLFKELGFPP